MWYRFFLHSKIANLDLTYDVKHVFHAFIAWWKPISVFTCSRILTKFAEVFNRLLRHRLDFQPVCRSAVFLLYFWTNHSQACKNRAGSAVINSISRLSNITDISGDGFTSSPKFVSQRFTMKDFEETQQEAGSHCWFVKSERCFRFTAWRVKRNPLF